MPLWKKASFIRLLSIVFRTGFSKAWSTEFKTLVTSQSDCWISVNHYFLSVKWVKPLAKGRGTEQNGTTHFIAHLIMIKIQVFKDA